MNIDNLLVKSGGLTLNRLGLVLALAATMAAALPAQAASCTAPPSNLVGWWPGDGTPNDLQGTNNAILQGGATATGTGLVGSAFTFDGTNNYVQVPDAPELRPTNFTVEGWVRFTALDSQGLGGSPAGQQYVVFRQNTRSTSFEGFNVYKTRVSSKDYLVFGVASSGGLSVEVIASTQTLASAWYHFAGVRGSNYIAFYVNGQLQGQSTVSFAQDYGNFPLYFGTTGQSFWDHKLRGLLDEVSIYNRPLSAAEVSAIYAAGASGKCKGLNIVTSPQSQTVVAGSNVLFSVTASGSPPLGYQWQFNGADVSGATGTSLTVPNAQSSNAGPYSVIVSNGSGSVTSSIANLTVLVPPAFAAQPQDASADSGASAAFNAAVTGTTPLTYRWRLNGSPISDDAHRTGTTTTNLQISLVAPTDQGTYTLQASNAAGITISSPAVLTVTGSPGIATQPAPQSVATGGNANFSVVATGTTPLSYQWRFNGGDLSNGGGIAGATSSALSLTGVTTNSAGNYQVVINNGLGSVTSIVASLTVNLSPAIVIPPASQTATAGTNTTFTVVASGAAPLSYQWRFNNANISNGGQFAGATTTALTITTVAPGNAGSYTVVVTNSLGSVTSAVATLTVVPPTDCIASPSGLVGWWTGDGSAKDIVSGNNGIFVGNANANATGKNGQCFKMDGTNDYVKIPDSPLFHLTNLSLEAWVNFDTYQVPGFTPYTNQQYIVFKQNSRMWEFEGFTLTKDHDPQGDVFLWEVASAGGILYRIDSVNTVVTGVWNHAVGIRGPDYIQLYMNGHLESQLSVPDPQDYGTNTMYFGTSGQDYYDRRLHGRLDEVGLYNRVLSSNEVMTLYLAGSAGRCKGTNGILINTQPQSQSVSSGTSVGFSVGAAGITPMTFQWQFNGSPIGGATNSSLPLTSVQSSNAGTYRVVVSNPAGTRISDDAVLTVLAAPVITQQPTNQTVIKDADVNFAVTATGQAPLSYQWRIGGAAISGKTDQTLSLNDVQSGDAGDYSVVVTNSVGSVTSEVATLTVLLPPDITVPPTNETVIAGSPASFSVGATGTAPMTYQWYKAGGLLGGETSASLNLPNAQPPQAGGYSVVVMNSAGAATSVVATLTVLMPPSIVAPPTNAAVLAGANVTFSIAATGDAPLAYQWVLNGTNNLGVASSALTLNNVQTSDAGTYTVTVSNGAGSTNAPATLVVLTHPVISDVQKHLDGSVSFVVNGNAGYNCVIEGSTNFTDWADLGTVTNTSGQSTFTDSAAAGRELLFYRARLQY